MDCASAFKSSSLRSSPPWRLNFGTVGRISGEFSPTALVCGAVKTSLKVELRGQMIAPTQRPGWGDLFLESGPDGLWIVDPKQLEDCCSCISDDITSPTHASASRRIGTLPLPVRSRPGSDLGFPLGDPVQNRAGDPRFIALCSTQMWGRVEESVLQERDSEKWMA